MSQESCFLSPQVTSAALSSPMLTIVKTDNFAHFQFLTTNIFFCTVNILTLCHRVHVFLMICDGLRILFFYSIVQNFVPACLKLSQTATLDGSGHAFFLGHDVVPSMCTIQRSMGDECMTLLCVDYLSTLEHQQVERMLLGR